MIRLWCRTDTFRHRHTVTSMRKHDSQLAVAPLLSTSEDNQRHARVLCDEEKQRHFLIGLSFSRGRLRKMNCRRKKWSLAQKQVDWQETIPQRKRPSRPRGGKVAFAKLVVKLPKDVFACARQTNCIKKIIYIYLKCLFLKRINPTLINLNLDYFLILISDQGHWGLRK